MTEQLEPPLQTGDLQLSPEGYIRMFHHFLPVSSSNADAFDRVEQYCATKGYKPRYSDLGTFLQVYYRGRKK